MELWIIIFASFVVSAVTSPIQFLIPPNQYYEECGVSGYESRVSTTGSCYRVSTETATWDEANASCEKEGAHLVILDSPEELAEVYNMLQDKPHDSETQYFAGVRADTTTEPRVFKTVWSEHWTGDQTEEEMGYYPWEEDEPNDYEGGENCVALDTRRHGRYNDVQCHVRMPYVCELHRAQMEIRAPSSTPSSVSAVTSPIQFLIPPNQYYEECGVSGYESRVSTTGSCYRVSTETATWDEANASCEKEGAHLVILDSPEELAEVYNMLQDKPHDSETQYFAGVRADTTTEPRVFKTVWSEHWTGDQTEEEMGYYPWEEDEPNDYEGGENCVALDTRRHGRYNDVQCHVRMPYVCELHRAQMEIHAPSSTPSSVPAVSSTVPSKSKQYRPDYEYNMNTDAFYKLHTQNDHKTHASEKCRDEGAELVEVISYDDLKQVHAMMEKLSDLEDYVMVASDDKCNVVNRKGEMETTTCDQELPFVCKVAAEDAPYNEKCGVYSNDYESRISTTGSCYRVSTDKATWNEAHASCQGEGAHLVILSNAEELEVLYNMLQDKPHDSETQYFAGVRADTTTEPRVFKNVFNQTLEEVGYGPWEEDEPNDYEGGENCVALDTRRHGKYNDVWCHVRMPYVCESSGYSVSATPLEINASPSTPALLPLPPIKHYRTDYEYNENTDAFYKLHTEGAIKTDASRKCIEEGAELVNISSDEDLKQVHAMMKNLSDLQDFVMVASEENSDYNSEHGYESQVVTRWGKIESTSGKNGLPIVCEVGIKATTCNLNLPFVCKVPAIDAPYSEECNVYSHDYVSRVSTTGSCYKISTVKATWDEANANCQAEGAHLVILNSAEELEVLYDMLKDEPLDLEAQQYFAGVTAATTTEPRVFKTVLNQTLEQVGYGPWAEGEPDNYLGDQNCVALDTRRHGKYNDIWCIVSQRFVCESPVTAPLEIHVPPSMLSSDFIAVLKPALLPLPPIKHYRTDYEYNENTDAFYKLHTQGATKTDASRKCIEEGAELVNISSDEDLKQVHAMMKNLSDLQNFVMVASEENSDYDSEHGFESKVVNRWGKIESRSGHNGLPMVCGIVDETLTCNLNLPFVCKVPAIDAPYNEECKVYSRDYVSRVSTTGSCYKVSTFEATWDEANANCQAEGAHLVILNSAEELEVLFNMLPRDLETQYFAGVTADGTTEPRVFKTVLNQTLEQVGYGPWEEDQPNNFYGENCVALDTRHFGKYNDVWCYVPMRFVCESPVTAPLEIRVPPSTPSSDFIEVLKPALLPLPPIKHYRTDYEYNENTDAFYKLHTQGATKTDASRKCIEEGAELVNISSDEELKQVHAMMKNLSDLENFVMVASEEKSDYDSEHRFESKVVNRWGKIESRSGHNGLPTVCGVVNETLTCNLNLPFVCKVPAIDAPYNEECKVFSRDYVSRVSTTGSCYKVSTLEATWDEANANCQAEGAHLVILNSAEELEVLFNVLPRDLETQYFAGVTADGTTEPRVFKTVLNQTLEQVGYGPWAEGEPDDYLSDQNCVALDTRRHGKYNDIWCFVSQRFVCESPVTAPLEIRVPPSTLSSDFIAVHEGSGTEIDANCNVVDSNCETDTEIVFTILPVAAKDASAYNAECGVYSNDYESKMSTTGSCYRVSRDTATWDEANASCENEGAHLVILNSAEELEVVYNMLQDKPHDSETQYFAGVRADTTTEPRVFETVLNQTLEEVGYGPWEQDEPNDYEGGENCVVLDTRRHGKYNDVWCHVRMPYVCESSGVQPEIQSSPSTPNSGTVQSGLSFGANIFLSVYSFFFPYFMY